MLSEAPPVSIEDDANRLCVVAITRRLFGEALATKLTQDFGGTRVYLPRSPEADHPVSRSIGHEKASAVAEQCFGVVMAVPLAGNSIATRRRELVKQMTLDGQAVGAIARTLRTSDRNVFIIRRALRNRGELPPTSDLGSQKC